MNKVLISLLLCSVCFVSAFFVSKAFAVQNISNISNVDDLVSLGKLSISVKVVQDEQQIVGQALVVSIEVATDRWFATGSRIQNFTLPNVIMQANNIITINGSKRIQGQTWAMQTHEITLYPTLAGNYTFPALNLDVSINTEDDGIVSGVLITPEASFTIILPEALNSIDNFIVSPEVTLTIDGQFDVDKNYAIGEAITQTITITASDTPAMMIPELIFFPLNDVTDKATDKGKEKTKQTPLDGISIYRKPAQVFDKSNRGSLLGSRVESFTYIFEKSGHYVLPKQVIYWWNSQSNALEELVIPAASWTVSGAGLSKMSQGNNTLSDIKLDLSTVIILVVSCVILALAYLLISKRLFLFTSYKKITHYEQRQISKQFLNSITEQEYLMASQYLYQYALLINKYPEIKSLSLTKKLNKLAFQADSNQKTQIKLSVSDAKALIKQIDILASKVTKQVNFSVNEEIKLNHK